MLCEPILILSNSPDTCSNVVLNLTSIIYPLKYAGDWRSYFTLHDPEYNAMLALCSTKEEHKRGVILGVTNPLFKKEFSEWPHLLIIGNEPKIAPEKRVVKQENNELFSSYKRFVFCGSIFI